MTSPSVEPGVTPATILVVEDNVILAKHIQKALQRAGYNVPAVAVTAAAVIPAIEKQVPDLMLMDITLDGHQDGIAVAVKIRERWPIPIIFVSAQTDRTTVRRTRDVTPHGFIVKPFTEQQLCTAVEVALVKIAAEPPPSSTEEDVRLRTSEQALQRIACLLAESGIVVPTMGGPQRPKEIPGLSTLSDREWEILQSLMENRRVPSIARTLHISPNTVRNHLKSIFLKLGVHSQEELLERLLRDGIPQKPAK